MTVTASANGERRFWRVPLIGALPLAFFMLALLSGVAYIVVLRGATGTADRLLIDRAHRAVEGQAEMIKSRLDPITRHLEFISALAAAGRLEVDSPIAMREALAIMMRNVTGVSIAGFSSLDLQFHRVVRHPDGSLSRGTVPLYTIGRGLDRLREMQLSHRTFWGALFWSNQFHQPMLNVRTPVRRIDDAFIGGLVATVAVGDLSSLMGDPGGEGGYFILVDGDHVLAHRRLVDPRGLNLSEDRPLPGLDEVGDAVLARFRDPPVRMRQLDRTLGDLGHVVQVGKRRWVFVYRELRGYGPTPWLVGQYFPIEEATEDIDRLTNATIVGGATLAVAALLGLALGLRMARSIRTITAAAKAIGRLEFDQPLHRRSALREIDDAAYSLERARSTLKWFGAYVPQGLVRRLMELGGESLPSRRRDVTVMFTDIVEFTPQAEDLPEQETAHLLNHHFALLGACIEHEQGVIDKYIGDSVMAVWGGLHRMEDHADRAVRAALAIVKMIHEDNAQRRVRGEHPIRLRIGLHSGRVVVGNIGAPGRVNYTVIGDAVNVAQRFEQLGKEFMSPDEEVVLLVSGRTLDAVREPAALGIVLPPPEQHRVKGHDEPVQVYRLA